jgi:hypothetical protein
MDAIHLMVPRALARVRTHMHDPHPQAQDHFDAGRHALAYVFARRAADMPRPPWLLAMRNVLLRDNEYLYAYEGQRLLGFAAQRVREWCVCANAMDRAVAARADDHVGRRVATECRVKCDAAAAASPVAERLAADRDAEPVAVLDLSAPAVPAHAVAAEATRQGAALRAELDECRTRGRMIGDAIASVLVLGGWAATVYAVCRPRRGGHGEEVKHM